MTKRKKRNKKHKKICILAYAEYYTDARIKAYVNTLLSQGDEYEIDVICLYDKFSKNDKNLKFHFIGKKYQGNSVLLYLINYFLFFIKSFFKFFLLNLKKRYNIIHVNNQPDFIVFCALPAKITGGKIILDMHDIMIAAIISKFNKDKNSLIFKLTKLQTKISIKIADVLILADHSQKEFLQENNINHKRTYVFLNLPDDKLFFKRTYLPKYNGYLSLVYHGTISYRLGTDFIVKAVKEASNFVDLKCTIIGNGEQKEELINYCVKETLLNRIVFFKDFIPVEDLQREIEKYDIGIIGNRKTIIAEKCMLPVKLIEYLAIGLPVISPRLQIIQRYFDDDILFYYEPENIEDLKKLIINLAQNERLRFSKNEGANKFFKMYNFKKQYQDYIKLIENLSEKNKQ